MVAGTNNQEVGVDEADLVKTDGRRLVALVNGTLYVTELDGTPTIDGTLDLSSQGYGAGKLFLRGDEAVVILPMWGSGEGPIAIPERGFSIEDGVAPGEPDLPVDDTVVEIPQPPLPFGEGVRILRVDLSDNAAPEVIEDRVVEGSLVASRMIQDTVRIVLRSPMPVMTELYSAPDVADAEAVLEDLDITGVLPRTVEDGSTEPLGDCQDIAVAVSADPPGARGASVSTSFADPSTVSVLTVGDELGDLAPSTVAGLADVVYASTDALWVTSTGWGTDGPSTFVHRFALEGDGPAQYTGSGVVPGTPLNQYSLSESGGDLRIVTTVEGSGVGVGEVAPGAAIESDPDAPVDDIAPPEETIADTEGRLTVLRPAADGTLVEIGAVEDLGVGERVQSVRFIGDMAYVVTFRQTDPLYAIELSDPANPRTLGEVKINGFSSYLHPVGDGLLLGIGRDATAEGTDTGFKASLFDVSDPAAPVELDKIVVPDAYSPVDDDPLAFTWDPVASNAIVPIERYGTVAGPIPVEPEIVEGDVVMPDAGALVIAVQGDQLSQVGEVKHPSSTDSGSAPILRSVIVDRDLWTVSNMGLGLTDADAPDSAIVVRF